MAQVETTVERAGAGRLDQALGHAATGGGAQLEVEGAQLTLEDLRIGERTRQQAGEQEQRGFEHASLHEQRGAGKKPAETLDLDVCKDTGECSALMAVRRFLIDGCWAGCCGRVPVQALQRSKRLGTSYLGEIL
ncbi:hypothetical protein D3C87_1580440 [compost metagenome]